MALGYTMAILFLERIGFEHQDVPFGVNRKSISIRSYDLSTVVLVDWVFVSQIRKNGRLLWSIDVTSRITYYRGIKHQPSALLCNATQPTPPFEKLAMPAQESDFG